MTLDPTIEARVRAKRACMLDQDRDVLALLDEVERLRDALADEHAGRCATELDHVGAVAMLAEQTARAERAEAGLHDVLRLMPVASVPAIAFTGHYGEYVRAVVDEVCAERDAARVAVKIVDANLIEQRARAENLEKALSIAATERQRVLSAIADAMHGPTLQPLAERVRGYVEECDRLGREKAEALAACAEMRAALVHIRERAASSIGEDESDALDICDAIERLVGSALREGDPLTGERPRPALLARPDLGAGVVVVPQEVVEGCRIVMNDALAHHQGGHSRIGKALRAAIADLDALLKKGGG